MRARFGPGQAPEPLPVDQRFQVKKLSAAGSRAAPAGGAAHAGYGRASPAPEQPREARDASVVIAPEAVLAPPKHPPQPPPAPPLLPPPPLPQPRVTAQPAVPTHPRAVPAPTEAPTYRPATVPPLLPPPAQPHRRRCLASLASGRWNSWRPSTLCPRQSSNGWQRGRHRARRTA
eukprot:1948920-Prymnesium_polylepis.2